MKRSQFAQFYSKLLKNLRTGHALDRLMFGQGPGDAEALSKAGLKKWMERQLHPLLEKRLRPVETLRLSPLEIRQRYPRQQNILAVLNGKPVLPDDPILCAAAQRYAGGSRNGWRGNCIRCWRNGFDRSRLCG